MWALVMAAALGAPRVAVITIPDVIRPPNAAAMERSYPVLALALDIEGYVAVLCRISKEGVVSDCAPGQEYPQGLGFATAAVPLALSMRFKPKTLDAVPVDTAAYIPIRFSIPERDAAWRNYQPPQSSKIRVELARQIVARRQDLQAQADNLDQLTKTHFPAQAPPNVDPAAWIVVMDAVSHTRVTRKPLLLDAMAREIAAEYPESALRQALEGGEKPLKAIRIRNEAAFAAEASHFRDDARAYFCAATPCAPARPVAPKP